MKRVLSVPGSFDNLVAPRRPNRHLVAEARFAPQDCGPSRVTCECGEAVYGCAQECNLAFIAHRRAVNTLAAGLTTE